MSNYLFNIIQQTQCPPTNSFSSSCDYCSNTINTCTNGYPTAKYPVTTDDKGIGTSSTELLYSIYNSYQQTALPQFLQHVGTGTTYTYPYCNPTSTTNPPNYINPTAAGMIGPKNIFIIRHGEKNTTTSSNTNPYYYINANGIYRACNLVNYINNLCENGYPITSIITANPSPVTTQNPSMRTEQTVSFASTMLNIPMYIFNGACDPTGNTAQTIFCANDSEFLPPPVTDSSGKFYIPTPGYTSSSLFNCSYNPFNGQNILIVWEHTNIQQLYLNIATAAFNKDRINKLPYTTDNNSVYNSIFDMLTTYNTTYQLSNGNYKYNAKNYSCSKITGKYQYSAPPMDPTYYFANQSGIITNNKNESDLIFEISPYWGDYCFDLQINFLSDSTNNLNFSICQQPINTCFANCNTLINMYQVSSPGGNPGYTYGSYANTIDGTTINTTINNEKNCQLPIPSLLASSNP